MEYFQLLKLRQYTKRTKNDTGNYCPVAVLPIFGKIFLKKLFNSRIYGVICSKKNNIYRKSALFRHFLAVFSLYRELCDLHKVDCAWIRTL